MFEDELLQTPRASILHGGKHDPDSARNISVETNPEPTVMVSGAHINLSTETLSSTQVIKDPNVIDPQRKHIDLKERYQTLQIIGDSIEYGYSIISPEEKTAGLKFDQIQDRLASANSICLGDLHGSYQKLVETLITSGLATMPRESAKKFVTLSKDFEKLISENPYLETVIPQEPPKSAFERLMERVFKTPQKESPTVISQAKILQNDLVDVIKTMSWTGDKGQKLILIGDIIGDRGPSDTLTLTVLSHLSKEDSDRFIRIASNHDHCAATFLLNGERTMSRDESQKRALMLCDNHEELKEQYLSHLKELKLLHYDKDSQTLYSHAPITPENLESLIANLKEEGLIDGDLGYSNINQDTIEEFIEIANNFYKEAITFPFENRLPMVDPIAEQTLNNPHDGFLWKRCHYTKSDQLPLVDKGVKILVHGHDSGSGPNSPFSIDRIKSDGEIKTQVVNLDNTVRKAPGYQTEENCRLFIQ
jgi:hypothetical protein